MNNIKNLRIKRGLKQSDLAEILHVKQNTISNWENEKTEINNIDAITLADFFNVSVDCLLGRTEIKKASSIQNEVELNDLYVIPLVGRVVAGVPLESEEYLEGYIYINYRPKEEYFALRVQGDSMINASIRNKSILVVHKQPYAENGDIVVALLNGEQTVKRFKIYGDNIFLMPENPDYDPIPVTKNANFLILGKVIEVRTTL